MLQKENWQKVRENRSFHRFCLFQSFNETQDPKLTRSDIRKSPKNHHTIQAYGAYRARDIKMISLSVFFEILMKSQKFFLKIS